MRDISKADDALEADVLRMGQIMVELGRKRSMRDPIGGSVEEMNHTSPQFHALLWLGNDVALTMGELAERIGVTEKTITGVVDRLQRDGYVLRERAEDDRRVVRVRLTKVGLTHFKKLEKHLRAKMTVVLGLLEAEDRQSLFRILEKLISRLGAFASGAAKTAANTKKGKA